MWNSVFNQTFWKFEECFKLRDETLEETLQPHMVTTSSPTPPPDPEMVSGYFDLLEQTLVENDLKGKPGQIFNMDESGMSLDPKSP